MVHLADYEGIDSTSAPGFEHSNWEDMTDAGYCYGYGYGRDFLLFQILSSVAGAFLGVIRRVGRKRKIRQLQAEVLPRAPGSLICPRCLRVLEQ